MIPSSTTNQRYVLGAFSLFFLYMLFCSFRGISSLHSTLHQQLGDRLLNEQHAFVANATSNELHAQYDEAFNIKDFGAMGDRVAKFTLLAESVVADPSSDRGPLISALREYFPWWQPLPTMYTPWQRVPSGEGNKTGIVICAGSSNLIYAMHLVLSLRNVHKSKLPIQIAYGGDHDLSFNERISITELGPDIETLNLRDYFNEEITGLETGGWAMKPFAMLASRYRKTIVLDADAMFVRSPDDLFDTEPGLLDTGTMFWHDRAFDAKFESRHDWVKEMMGDRTPSAMLNQSLFWKVGVYHEQDSAAVCMDKGRPNVFMSLLFTTWMNLESVRDKVTYRHVHGDKETFWLASELSYSPYYFHPNYAGVVGDLRTLPQEEEPLDDPPSGETSTELRDAPAKSAKLQSKFFLPSHLQPKDTHEICSGQALHLDHLGRPLWFNGSLRKDKSQIGHDLDKLKKLLSYAKSHEGERDRRAKDLIKEIARKLDMGTFTHWLPGTVTWDFHPNWSMANVISCLKSKADAVELDPVMKDALNKAAAEARKADEKFYGFDKIGMTLPIEA